MGSPPDQYEHVMLAFLCGSYAHDLDFISRFQRRDCAESDTPGRKRELQGIGKIVIPPCRLLFRAIGVHDDLHVDTLFTFFMFGLTSHMHSPVTGENR